jgi:hypothetical protein
MWNTYTGGSGTTLAVSQQAHTLGQTLVPTSSPYFLRATSVSGTDVAEYTIVDQNIENVASLAGKTVTVSFYAKASSGTPNIAIEGGQAFGTGGSPSNSITNISVTTVTLSTTFTKYDVTLTFPSITGKTLGSDSNSSYTQILFWLSSGSNYNSRNNSLGHQSITVDFGLITLHEGTNTYPYIERSPQEELNLISRYYQSWYKPCIKGLFVSTSNAVRCGFTLSNPMRSAPATTGNLRGTIDIFDGTNVGTITSLSAAYTSIDSFEFDTTVATGTFVAFRPASSYIGSNDWYILLDARL